MVEPGRLIEARTESGGTDRRAHGEFVGPNGELASYALGWTTGTEDDHGRISIGIGVGDPAGGTFHAAVFSEDDNLSFALLDERFEDVPQGGPHLTAAQAREHVDLAFVWWVAGQVMERDPRARWMMHWLDNTPAVTTPQVAAHEEPILLVVNDTGEDDPYWQLIGTSDAGEEGAIVHLHHVVDDDPTLAEVLDLAPGEAAFRDGANAPWTRTPSRPLRPDGAVELH